MTSPSVTDRSSLNQRAYGVKAMAVMALLVVLAGLIAWAMWRGGKWFRGENGSAWQYQPAPAAEAPHPKTAGPGDAATLPSPGVMPDPTAATTPNLSSTPLRKPRAAIRMPLARPVPQPQETDVTGATKRKRHHRKLLGLGKLWHWIRRDHRKTQE